MKKIKLFTELFFSTLFITLFITLLAHELLFFLAPVLSKETNNDMTAIVKDFSFFTEITFQSDDYISNTIRKALPYSILLCCIVSLIFSYFFSKMISSPIKRIAESTAEMAKLEKDVHCNENSCYEISLLSKNVTTLYKHLFTTIEKLEYEKLKTSENEKLKVDFLRAASHELKTPVTALNAILENMILEVGKYKDYSYYLPKCKTLSDHLGKMICDILNASNMNMLTDDDPLIEINLNDILTDLCVDYQLIAASKGQIFQLCLENTMLISTRKNLFCMAISNILNNAVSYTDSGKKITITLKDNILFIKNECLPLPVEDLKHIFEPFYRFDYSRDRNTGGNGLGLYLTATILRTLDITFTFSPSLSNDSMEFKIII